MVFKRLFGNGLRTKKQMLAEFSPRPDQVVVTTPADQAQIGMRTTAQLREAFSDKALA